MKTASMRLADDLVKGWSTGQDRRRKRTVAAGLVWLWLAATGIAPAQAQETPAVAADDAADERKAGLWIQPSVSAGLTHTDNSLQAEANPRSDNILELGASVYAVFNTARIRGDLNYSVNGIHFTDGTQADSTQQALDAYANLDLWRDRVFLDLAGVIDYQSISAFGPPSVDTNRNDNLTQQQRVLVSPYYRGALTTAADAELRYTYSVARNDAVERSDNTETGTTVLVRSRRDPNIRLGWSVEAGVRKVDYSLERETTAQALRAGLSYDFTPDLSGNGFVGSERNDVLTLETESYSTWGLGVDWRPSDRSRVSADLEHHYYGDAHSLTLEQRSGRTVWRLSDWSGVVGSSLDEAVPLMSSTYDLLDSHYLGQEADPIRRAQMVQAELERLGFSNTEDLYRRYLTSSSRVERNQQFAVLLTGLRSVYTIAFGQNKSRRLDSDSAPLGDDFDTSESIRQRYWSLQYAHRLTPRSSVSTALSGMKTDGSGGALSESSKILQVGFTTQLAPRTSGSVRFQRISVSGTAAYTETSWRGMITHRF